ncbi:MAG: Gfo/Idh/MocA family oxidoreductase [Thermomicrobiales bacterium]
MLEPRYRVGIIGTGRIASTIQDEIETAPFSFLLPYSHAGAYAAHPATTIVAAADSNQERLDAFGARWGVEQLYPDYREMLAAEPLDLVSICVPTRAHTAVMNAVIASNSKVRGVFMEKPVGQTLREVDVMIAAADAAGIRSVVNHVRTFDPYYRRIRWLIETGAIGTVRTVMVHWHEGMSFGGSHLFDLLRFLLGAEAAWVFARLDREPGLFDPGGSGVVGFANGVEVFLNNSVGHAAPRELDIVGDAGRIRAGDTLFPELSTQDPASPFGELVRRPFPGSVIGTSPMTVAVGELLRAVETGEKPASDLRDGRANLEIAVACHLSDRARQSIDLPVHDLDLAVDDPWGRT